MPSTIFLGLGSNLGDRQANLLAAAQSLPPKITLTASSPIYETEPWGYLEQAKFLNQVLQANTSLSPLELLTYLKAIEKEIGRTPTFKNGPREIDIDILLYDDVILESPDLTIPHPRLHQRAFMLIPMNDLAEDLIHPVHLKTIRHLLADIDTAGINTYVPNPQ